MTVTVASADYVLSYLFLQGYRRVSHFKFAWHDVNYYTSLQYTAIYTAVQNESFRMKFLYSIVFDMFT